MYYSQCGEDKFLNDFIFKNKTNGVYIELGAIDGVLYSNTKFFEDTLNWTGILIEPNPFPFKYLQYQRPKNYLFNDLVSCNKDPLKYRYFENGFSAVSGVESTLPQKHMISWFESDDNAVLACKQDSILLHPKTLSEIVKTTNFTHIDLLSLDVEGHEYEVLLSWDFSIPIDVILIEMLGDQPEKDELCRKILIEHNYKCLTKYKHNEIYALETYMNKKEG